MLANHLTLLGVILVLTWSPAGAQSYCGDCDDSGNPMPTVLDALLAARLHIGLSAPTASQLVWCDVDGSCSVTILDALGMAQIATGLPYPLACNQSACSVPRIISCRAVSGLLTTATGPVGVNPAFTTLNGGPGFPPASGRIADASQRFENFWSFDYIGLNEGEFNDIVQLTDQAGNNVGNPVVLFSAGHDYRPTDVDPVGRCNPRDTFQMVIEAIATSPGGTRIFDLSPAVTPYLGANLATRWDSSAPGIVSVSPDGLLQAESENGCATISWSFTSDAPRVIVIDPACVPAGSFVACVDSAGVDTATRTDWLPEGDMDACLPGLPSGPPALALGAEFGLTVICNSGDRGVGGYVANIEFDPSIFEAITTLNHNSVGGSTVLGPPFSVNPSAPGLVRWSDIDAFARTSGVFDCGGVNLRVTGTGSGLLEVRNVELADGSGCNIWVSNSCMPFSSFLCPTPPPAGGYKPVAGGSVLSIR